MLSGLKANLFIGYLTKTLGYLFYGIGALTGVALASTFENKAGRKFFEDGFTIETFGFAFLYILGLILCLGLVKLGHFLHLLGKKLLVKYGAQDVEFEQKPFVLYLRSFTDDNITSKTSQAYLLRGVPLPQLTTEEELLAQEFRPFGSFISAAKPGQALPNPGAAQIHFSESNWKDEMKKAEMVLIRAGNGLHLLWEINEALELVKPEKLIFLMPAEANAYTDLRPILSEKLKQVLPKPPGKALQGNTPLSALLYFDNQFNPYLSECYQAGFRASSARPLKPILRYALKPLFLRAGKKWKPPPIPKQVYIPVIFNAYLTGLCLVWAVPMLNLSKNHTYSFETKWDLLFLFMDGFLIFGIVKGIRGLMKGIPILKKAIRQKELIN